MIENPVDNILIYTKVTKLISQEQSIGRTQRGMTDKEQQIRVEILPQLNSLANFLWDNGNPQRGRKLDKIIEELEYILNQEDTP